MRSTLRWKSISIVIKSIIQDNKMKYLFQDFSKTKAQNLLSILKMQFSILVHYVFQVLWSMSRWRSISLSSSIISFINSIIQKIHIKLAKTISECTFQIWLIVSVRKSFQAKRSAPHWRSISLSLSQLFKTTK